MLPIGRWKGYGGDTDYQGAAYETITWATGLLAATERLDGVRDRPRAAVSPADRGQADGHRRPRRSRPLRTQHRLRLERGRVRDVRRRRQGPRGALPPGPGVARRDAPAPGREDDFDFDGEFYRSPGRAREAEAVRRDAAADDERRRVGRRPRVRAAQLRRVVHQRARSKARARGRPRARDPEDPGGEGRSARATAARSASTRSASSSAARRARKPRSTTATSTLEHADWGAIDNTLRMKGLDKLPPDDVEHHRRAYANGHGGLPLIGTPDEIAETLATISRAGFTGIGTLVRQLRRRAAVFLGRGRRPARTDGTARARSRLSPCP